jgi:hypothetical protein
MRPIYALSLLLGLTWACESSPLPYVCRTVRILVPADGILTASAVSADPGVHALVEMEGPGDLDCCYLGNPLSMNVAAGMVVLISVEILEGLPSQTFTLTATIR